MLTIETKPHTTIPRHKGVIELDTGYKVEVERWCTNGGHAYSVNSDLQGDEKRIVEAAVLNHLNKHGIK